MTRGRGKRTRGRERGRRPVALGVALVAPAILAGGLMVGELGYRAGLEAGGTEGRSEGARVVPLREAEGARWVEVRVVAFEPTWAPAPPHPDVTYEGVLPEPLSSAPRPVVAAEVPEVSSSVVPREVEPRTKVRPSPRVERRVRPRAGCPGEWRETWLWELCREHERQAVEELPRA